MSVAQQIVASRSDDACSEPTLSTLQQKPAALATASKTEPDFRAVALGYAAACVSTVAMSASPTLIRLMPSETPSLLKMCWRLVVLVVLQIPLAALEWRALSAARRTRVREHAKHSLLLGALVAMNYATYALAVDTTSLVHAMLLTSMTPLMFIVAAATSATALTLFVRRKGNEPLVSDAASANSALCADNAALVAVGADKVDDSAVSDWHAVLPIGAPPLPPGITPDLGPPNSSAMAVIAATELSAASPTAVVAGGGAAAGAPVATASPALEVAAPLTTRSIFARLILASRFPSALELVGAALGIAAAAAIILVGADSADAPLARPATLLGDLVAVLCACSFCLYISVSAVLREAGTPTFLLLLPANGVAALLLAAVLLLSGSAPACCAGAAGLVDGWASSGTTFGVVIAMGVIPGLIGHGGMTLALTVVAPLSISLIGLNQIWIAVVFGAAVGAQGMPSAATLAAAPFVVGAAVLAILGNERAKRARARAAAASAATSLKH